MSLTRLTAANGLSVDVSLNEHEDGPYVTLSGVDCDLEGSMPGEYRLVPRTCGCARCTSDDPGFDAEIAAIKGLERCHGSGWR